MPYFVYALVDPRTDVVFYIGITNSINERLKQHINYKDSNTEKRAWIQRLKEKNLVPSMKVLDMVKNRMAAVECEEYWIYYYLGQGVQLTNRQLYLIKHIKREADRTQEQECRAVKQ